MASRKIIESQFLAEDIYENFIGIYEKGDFLDIFLINGDMVSGTIEEIKDDYLLLEDEDFELQEVKYSDIENVQP